jgi:hypothetical protein
MDQTEFRKRLEAVRAHALVQRLEAVEMLATNVDLSRENSEAFARQGASQLGEDHQVGVQPDPIPPPDAER